MVKKTITGVMAGVLAAGMVTPAMATEVPNLDALNKTAYSAVIAAKEAKTQATINEARVAVQALKEAKPDSEFILEMVSTYSAELDAVQQPILSVAIKATLKAEESGKQEDVNAGFKVLPKELLELDGTSAGNKDFWRNKYRSLSSILDKVQKNLQDEAFTAVKKAEKEMTSESIEAAKKLVAEVAKSDKEAIKDWAKLMEDRLNAIGTFKVVKVKDITTEGVTVEFNELKEDALDVTLKVVDADGNVHAVETFDFIEKGSTEKEFKFKTTLKEEAKGVWTVDGVEYDATIKTVITAIKNKDTSQVNLDKIFTHYGFTGYNNANMVKYQEMIQKVSAKIETLEDVQKLVIDAVNTNIVNEKLVAEILKVAKEGNDIQFANKLKESKIERVNTAWLTEYRTAIKGLTGDVTFTNIVDAVNDKNDAKVNAEVTKVDGKATIAKDVAAARTLMETYFTIDTEASKKEKAELVKKLDTQDGIIKVIDAKVPSAVVNAIVALDSASFDTKKFANENLGAEYVTIVAEDFKGTVTLANLETIIKAKNVTATTAAVTELAKVAKDTKIEEGKEITTAQIAKLNKAFANLEKVSAKETVKFEMKTLDKNAYAGYVTGLASVVTVADVNAAVKTANENVVKNHFVGVNADTIVAKLESAVAKFGVKNFNKANAEAYKANVTEFTTVNTVKAIQTLVDTCNEIAIIGDKTSTTAEMFDALTQFAELQKDATILNTKEVVRMDIAELIVRELNNEGSTVEITTIVEVVDEYTEAKTAQDDMVKAVNEALKTVDGPEKSTGFVALADALTAIEGKTVDNGIAQRFYENSRSEKDGKVTFVNYTNFTQVRATLAK